MPALLALRIDGNPVRMRIVDVLMNGVRIGARDDVHTEFAAALDQITERVPVAQPLTSVVKRDFCRIESDASSGTQASSSA